MGILKRIVRHLVLLVFFLATVMPAFAIQFNDVDPKHPAAVYIDLLTDYKYMAGVTYERFGGELNLNRFQLAESLYNLLGNREVPGTMIIILSDISPNSPLYPRVTRVLQAELMDVFTGNFEGLRPVTRYELAHGIHRLLKFMGATAPPPRAKKVTYKDALAPDYADDVDQVTNTWQITEGLPDGTFLGTRSITRYEAAFMLGKTAALIYEDFKDALTKRGPVIPSAAPTPSIPATPSNNPPTAVPTPLVTPMPIPTIVPPTPTVGPSLPPSPTAAPPTAVPSTTPTSLPTTAPTAPPTGIRPSDLECRLHPNTPGCPTPTPRPTTAPTAAPTAKPTAAPTAKPTVAPTAKPTAAPTAKPTVAPTAAPTVQPSAPPSPVPSASGSLTPDQLRRLEDLFGPSTSPSSAPPTVSPSAPPPTTPPAKPTTPPAKPTAPPAKPTAPPAKPTAPPAKPTAPPAKPTAPPAKPTAPPAKPTAPPAKPTAPPAKPTAPPPTPHPTPGTVVSATPSPTASGKPSTLEQLEHQFDVLRNPSPSPSASATPPDTLVHVPMPTPKPTVAPTPKPTPKPTVVPTPVPPKSRPALDSRLLLLGDWRLIFEERVPTSIKTALKMPDTQQTVSGDAGISVGLKGLYWFGPPQTLGGNIGVALDLSSQGGFTFDGTSLTDLITADVAGLYKVVSIPAFDLAVGPDLYYRMTSSSDDPRNNYFKAARTYLGFGARVSAAYRIIDSLSLELHLAPHYVMQDLSNIQLDALPINRFDTQIQFLINWDFMSIGQSKLSANLGYDGLLMFDLGSEASQVLHGVTFGVGYHF